LIVADGPNPAGTSIVKVPWVAVLLAISMPLGIRRHCSMSR
jgi:hypothetical protein